MSIKLSLEDYCQECESFSVKDNIATAHSDNRTYETYHSIECERAAECHNIYLYILNNEKNTTKVKEGGDQNEC